MSERWAVQLTTLAFSPKYRVPLVIQLAIIGKYAGEISRASSPLPVLYPE